MSETTIKTKQNFTSYVNEALNCSEDAMQKDFKPKLLSGEIEAARAGNVSLFIAQTKRNSKELFHKDDKLGLLLITNFRLSFISFDNESEMENVSYQENSFLGKYDVSLSNIDKIFQITDKKKKLVRPDVKNSSKIEAIRIVCKNFRVLTFGFKASEVGKGKYIADALVKFAFPARHSLLFLYNFKEKYYNTSRSVRMFNQKTDWTQELERCGAQEGWRVFSRDRLELDDSLPMHYIVPKHLTDMEYFKLSKSFRNSRSAIWVWSRQNAALVRMADLSPELTNTTHENTMLEHVRKCNPSKRQPHLMELPKLLPSIQDVELSYIKLRELCAPESDRQFMVQDTRFHSLLDKTYWLLYVSLCLKYSNEAAIRLKSGETVVLQEINGRDMCCVISSLVQLLLDHSWRTINGFQTLIQKEWISLGHPFSDRLGHVANNSNVERGPLFLLFLDCVWQLLQQCPEDFEFSETFLTTIWDSVFLPIFDTFQFNSECERQIAMNNDRLILRPVWDWGEQFADKDIALFSNPLYKKPLIAETDLTLNRKSKLPPTAYRLPGIDDLKLMNSKQTAKSNNYSRSSMHIGLATNAQDRYIEPQYALRDLEIWQQCYFRWIPFLEIKNGGTPQIDLFNRLIVNNIHKLQKMLEAGTLSSSNDNNLNSKSLKNDFDDERNSIPTTVHGDSNEFDDKLPTINSFFPFSSNISNSAELTDILILNGELLTEGSIFDASSLVYQE